MKRKYKPMTSALLRTLLVHKDSTASNWRLAAPSYDIKYLR